MCVCVCVKVLSFEFHKYLGGKKKNQKSGLHAEEVSLCGFKELCNSQIQLYCCAQPSCPPTSLRLLLAQRQQTNAAVGLHALGIADVCLTEHEK